MHGVIHRIELAFSGQAQNFGRRRRGVCAVAVDVALRLLRRPMHRRARGEQGHRDDED